MKKTTMCQTAIYRTAIYLALAIFASPLFARETAVYRAPSGRRAPVVKNEILVVFREDASQQAKAAAHGKMRGAPVYEESDGVFWQKVAIADGESLEDTVSDYKKDPAVKYAAPNYIRRAETVNDPLYTAYSTDTMKQWGLAKIDIANAWTLSTGTGVVIAVFDTGISTGHPDFAGQIYSTITFIGTTGAIDYHGHGTHVAGIAAARSNGQYVVGVATNSKILAVKVLDDDGAGTSEALLRALVYVSTCAARPKVVNMSLGGSGYSEIEDLAIQTVYQKGIALIASKGNDAVDDSHYPSDYNNVFSVGATNSLDQKAAFSNYGPELDIVAPGGDGTYDANGNFVMSEGVVSTYLIPPATYYAAGTSMASPFVAGAAALVFSVNPSLKPLDVYKILAQSADDLGTAGFDTYYGNGRLNAYKAARMATNYVAPSSAKAFTYPNPIYLYKNQRAQFYVPASVDDGTVPKVRVYNFAGELVRSATMREWNGKDDAGNPVQTGLYFFALETPRGKSTGKMTVIR